MTAATTATTLVLGDVAGERRRQDEKWGEQRHIGLTGDQEHALRPLAEVARYADLANATSGTLAYLARQACQANGRDGRRDNWTAILLEEVFEALAEDDPAALRRELVQVAAVAVQWAERIDAGDPQ